MGLRADNLNVHTMVAAWEWPSYMDPEAREKGIKVKLSSYKRQVKNPVSNAKVNGNYVHSIVALTEALEAGFDEALMLDADGYIAEGSGENFYCKGWSSFFAEPRFLPRRDNKKNNY